MAQQFPRSLRRIFQILLAAHLLLPLVGQADENTLPTVNLSAHGDAEAPNDFASAEAYVELTGPNPKQVAAQVNQRIAAALATAKGIPTVNVRTSQTSTWPVYAKNSRTISAWRMRSAIALESADLPALSALIGQLQERVAVGRLSVMPAPESLAKAEDEATLVALAAFEKKAKLIADALHRRYRIKTLDVGTNHSPVVRYRAAMAADAEAAAPAPIEAGQRRITIQVNGVIELID